MSDFGGGRNADVFLNFLKFYRLESGKSSLLVFLGSNVEIGVKLAGSEGDNLQVSVGCSALEGPAGDSKRSDGAEGEVEGGEDSIDQINSTSSKGSEQTELGIEEHGEEGSDDLGDDDGGKDGQEEGNESDNFLQIKKILLLLALVANTGILISISTSSSSWCSITTGRRGIIASGAGSSISPGRSGITIISES
jgi:hypothetical protein